MITMFYTRWQQDIIKNALKTRRVLLLSGPRQCGKTTLAKHVADKHSTYLTLDNLSVRELAQQDPHGFVIHSEKMLIIDEVQRAPELLSAIKLVVDENTAPGQYLLTGSANIQSLPTTKESLAGRIRNIRLRPLTQGEILGKKPLFIDHLFEEKIQKKSQTHYHRKAILDIAFRGGFPETLHFNHQERHLWHQDYLNALLERDLKDITHIVHHQAMQDLIKTLAAWSGKFMDISAIGSGLSIRRPTIESYINALEALYLIERIQPWTQTDYERVGKQSKLYMTDSGLMASILKWRIQQVELNADRSGKIIETFIFNELAAQIDASNGRYQLFHYRDREKREIDFLIERDDEALLGIEVKAGSSISTADFKHLKWFQENIAKKRPFIGIVLYTGDIAGSMGNGLWAIPIHYLWQ